MTVLDISNCDFTVGVSRLRVHWSQGNLVKTYAFCQISKHWVNLVFELFDRVLLSNLKFNQTRNTKQHFRHQSTFMHLQKLKILHYSHKFVSCLYRVVIFLNTRTSVPLTWQTGVATAIRLMQFYLVLGYLKKQVREQKWLVRVDTLCYLKRDVEFLACLLTFRTGLHIPVGLFTLLIQRSRLAKRVIQA